MDVCTYGRPSAGLDAKGTSVELPARIHFGGGIQERRRENLSFSFHMLSYGSKRTCFTFLILKDQERYKIYIQYDLEYFKKRAQKK